MAQARADIVRRVLNAVGRRDLDCLLELTDPEIEWRSFFSELGEYRGHDGMRRYLDDVSEAWEILNVEVDDLLESGDLVIGVGRIHFRGKESGAASHSPAGWVFRLRNGRVLRFRAFRDPEQTLARLGEAD